MHDKLFVKVLKTNLCLGQKGTQKYVFTVIQINGSNICDNI